MTTMKILLLALCLAVGGAACVSEDEGDEGETSERLDEADLESLDDIEQDLAAPPPTPICCVGGKKAGSCAPGNEGGSCTVNGAAGTCQNAYLACASTSFE